jgi:hypothetical protein
VKKLEATITLDYDDEQTAKAIANAVSPDNLKTPVGLTVKTVRNGSQVITEISLEGKMTTFIATIDDLLSCATTAEKTLHVVRRK